ncbi:aminotransferase [Roseococcus suduntuyensis]|uniref:Aspartate/methionine/tyrosine aminotransferase n=1 Tax=Roseococcus suduntuyensis TaxID=455361 RepID=A0A840AF75_9PROT|nr:aminotransferase [Roseococcus suduntuyensis]MBB3899552.1 aspartate/methionine/tyrosine aminotransferase [Roseococcus suduntuyensis]
MQPMNHLLSATGTTIFTVMSALAVQHGAINLGQGFPDYDGPEDVIEAAAAALKDGRNQYPPMTGVPELRRAVAEANRRFYGLEVDPDREVVVTSGATEAITACLMAVLNPGDECVLIEPLYDTYLPVVKLLGAVPKLVRLSPPKWELPRAELAAAFGPKTKAVLFNTPMNPTGKVFTAAELAFLADLIERHDCYAICDEVYEHLTYDGWKHIPLMTLPGMRGRCMRIGSAGKTFSLTGWKVGYVTCDAALQPNVAKAHQNLTFTTPPNLQRAVAVGLAKDDAYFDGLSGELAERRDLLTRGLQALGFETLPVMGSYFVTADIRSIGFTGDDVAFCRAITEEAKVTAIPVTAFYAGPNPPSHYARFAFCKNAAVLEEALARLGAWVAARGAGTARASA